MRFVIMLCLSLFGAPTHALHPLITEDTGTQGQGHAQVELAMSYERDQEGDSLTRRRDPSLVLTYGLHDAVDIFASLPYVETHTHSETESSRVRGAADPSLGIKWRFYEAGPWSMALKPSILFAIGNEQRGLGKGRSGVTLPLVVSRQWEGLALHMHGAYVLNRNVLDERKDLWHASVAGEYHPNDRMKWVLDLGVDRQTDKSKHTNPAYWLGGLVYSFGRLDFSLGLKGKLNAVAADRAWLFGLTWRTQ